jgi:hypothetical protein
MKITFLWKPHETKRLAAIFCEAFVISKKLICFSRPGVISALKKDSFHPPAVSVN